MTPFWIDHHRDFVAVTGVDALSFLQSQISQDISALADDASTYSLVLQPNGKIDALVRVMRHSGEDFTLDTDAGYGETLVARLNRFKIRVKVDIAPLALRCIAVRHAGALGGATAAPHVGLAAWGSDDAFDVVGEDPRAPEGIREGSLAEFEAARIAAGWPAMGSEITDASIPAETGVVSEAVSFTKGCYPGQELVERMDSRGSQAPRFVRALRCDAEIAAGDEVIRDSAVVGHVTSAAARCDTDGASQGWLALAIVARSVQPGDTVTVRSRALIVEHARATADTR